MLCKLLLIAAIVVVILFFVTSYICHVASTYSIMPGGRNYGWHTAVYGAVDGEVYHATYAEFKKELDNAIKSREEKQAGHFILPSSRKEYNCFDLTDSLCVVGYRAYILSPIGFYMSRFCVGPDRNNS